jgi:hypothetical protein
LRKNALNNHFKTHNKKSDEFKCGICKKNFQSEVERKSHFKNIVNFIYIDYLKHSRKNQSSLLFKTKSTSSSNINRNFNFYVAKIVTVNSFEILSNPSKFANDSWNLNVFNIQNFGGDNFHSHQNLNLEINDYDCLGIDLSI